MVAEQLTFPQLTAYMSHSRISLGACGEVWAACALESAGYRVRFEHQCGDLVAISPAGEILHVEVKTARQGKDRKWRFTLYKYWQNRVCADHRKTDFVALLCVLKSGDVVPFVVPTCMLYNQHQVVISSYPRDYAGKFRVYRQPGHRKLQLGGA